MIISNNILIFTFFHYKSIYIVLILYYFILFLLYKSGTRLKWDKNQKSKN